MTDRRFFVASIAGLAAVGLSGCGQPAWQNKVAPVSGVVTMDGEPLSLGFVRFYPQDGRRASGKIEADGSFRLSTYASNDGAAIGLNRVAVLCRKGDDLAPNPNDDETGPPPRWLIPLAYAGASSSKITRTVNAGDNHFEIALSSDGP